MWTTPRETPAAPPHNEGYCSLAIFHPPTGYVPNGLDDFHYSETTAMEPSYLCDAELDDETIGKALSSPLFIQEREEPADRRQAYPSSEERLLPAQSFFTRTRTGRPVYEPSSCERKSGRDMENQRIRILLEQKKFSLILKQRFRNTSFKPIMIGEVSRNWMELSTLSEEKLIILLHAMNNSTSSE